MALRYYFKDKIGEMTVAKGDQRFKIQICRGNCLAVFIHAYKNEEGEKMHALYCFFNDTQHVKNIMEEDPNLSLLGDVRSIKINTFYKEGITLINLLTKAGFKVTAYYKKIQ